MATLAGSVLTLLDYSKRLAPNGSVESDIVELLSQQNEILTDMLWLEGNLETGHRTTMRTGLPTNTWRKLNVGTEASKSTTVQVDEACGMLFSRGQIDIDLASLNGNTAAFRLSENEPHMESMAQDMAETLFYGDTDTNPEQFLGLSPRYSDLSAGNGGNILDAGGTTGLTSIWLVCWGKKSCHGIFPKGQNAGIKHKAISDATGDGATDAQDSSGRSYRAYVDEYQWKAGLALRDWRYVVRIANIDIAALTALTGTQATTAATFIVKLMVRAMARVPNFNGGIKPVFYMNRTIHTLMEIAAMEKTSNVLKIEDGLNQFTVKFRGVPIRKNDALIEAESRVT